METESQFPRERWNGLALIGVWQTLKLNTEQNKTECRQDIAVAKTKGPIQEYGDLEGRMI